MSCRVDAVRSAGLGDFSGIAGPRAVAGQPRKTDHRPLALAEYLFAAIEEEQLVPLDRTAKRPTPIVATNQSAGNASRILEEAVGVQNVVLDEIKSLAMEPIGAGFGLNQND